jgi:WD40 repeat protein
MIKIAAILQALLFLTATVNSQDAKVLTGNKGNVNTIAFSPDSKTIVSGDESGNLIFRDAETYSNIHSIEAGGNITSVNYSNAGKDLLVYTTFEGYITVIKAGSKNIVKNFRKDANVYYAVFSPDGDKLAVTYLTEPSEKDRDKGVRVSYSVDIYETVKYEKLKTLRLARASDFTGEIIGSDYFETYRFDYFNCEFNPAGTYIASGSLGKNIPIYSFEYKKFAPPYKGHSGKVYFVTFSPDGTYLASASKDETVKLWNVSSGGTILTLKGHKDDVNCVAFSPDSKYAASASDDETVKIWDVSTTKLLKTLDGFNADVITVKFSPDGKYIAASGRNERVLVWEVLEILQ